MAAAEGIVGDPMSIVYAVIATLARLLLEVLPFFAVGALTGALVQTYMSPRVGERLFGGSGLRPLLAAVTAGAVLPGCACTTMPMARGLKGTGVARLGTVAAFILVSPLLSPITIALTWGVLGWQITVARVVASFVGALILGAIVIRFESWFDAEAGFGVEGVGDEGAGKDGSGDKGVSEEGAEGESCGCSGSCASESPQKPTFWRSLWEVVRDTSPYFLLGMLIAAALVTLVPEDAVPRLLGSSSGVWAYALAVVVGIPLYVCEGEEVPLTLALLAVGLGTGPALAFMLGSVGTCIPTVLMAQKVIGKRTTVFYILFWFVFVVVSGLIFQAVYSG
jgi:uncharacterized membrane protein YraQ (UPF0718 family)